MVKTEPTFTRWKKRMFNLCYEDGKDIADAEQKSNKPIAKWSDMMSGTDSKILDAITRTQRPVNRSV